MGAIKSPKCSKGHKFTPENIVMRSNGQRECRACKKARSKLAAERKKAAECGA